MWHTGFAEYKYIEMEGFSNDKQFSSTVTNFPLYIGPLYTGFAAPVLLTFSSTGYKSKFSGMKLLSDRIWNSGIISLVLHFCDEI